MGLPSFVSFAVLALSLGKLDITFKNGQTSPSPSKHQREAIRTPLHRHTSNITHHHKGSRGVADPLNVDNEKNAYYIQVGLGTPPQNVWVLIDTGSVELWVDPNCANAYDPATCNSLPRYDPSKSSTATDEQVPFSIQYGTGSVTGEYYLDVLTIGNAKITDEIFGVASQSSFAITGIMGLGWGHNYNTGYYTTTDLFPANGITNSKLFSIDLGTQQKQEAEIVFGGVDTMKYSGALGKVPVSAPGADFTYRWWVDLTSVGITKPGSQTSQKLTGAGYRVQTFLDTGTTISAVPQGLFNAILGFFPGAQPASPGSTLYTVPCSFATAKGTVDFGFGSTVINVPYSEFLWVYPTVCYLGVEATTGDVILGDTFLRGAYVAYDQDSTAVFMANYVDCGTNVVAVPAGNSAVLAFTGQCPKSTTTTSSTSTSSTTTKSTSTSSTSTSTTKSSTTTTSSTSTSTTTTKSSTSTSTTKPTSTSTSTSTTKSTSTSTSSTKTTSTTATPTTTKSCAVDKCLSTMYVTSRTSSASSFCNSVLATSVPTISAAAVPRFLTVACGTTSLAASLSSACNCFEGPRTGSATASATAAQGCVIDKCVSTMQVATRTSSASSFCNSLLATPLATVDPATVPRFLTVACGKTSLAASLSSACGCFKTA